MSERIGTALHKHTHRKLESQASIPGQQPRTLRPSHESANTPRLARSGSTDQREFNRALTSAALAAPPPPLIVWSPLVPSIAWSPLTGCVVRVVVCSDPDVLFVARVSANLLCCRDGHAVLLTTKCCAVFQLIFGQEPQMLSCPLVVLLPCVVGVEANQAPGACWACCARARLWGVSLFQRR